MFLFFKGEGGRGTIYPKWVVQRVMFQEEIYPASVVNEVIHFILARPKALQIWTIKSDLPADFSSLMYENIRTIKMLRIDGNVQRSK